MAFCRADRDQHHFTGSDDPHAPDYVKLPPARSLRDAAREARNVRARSLGGAPKQQLPRVPLKTARTHYRPAFFTKELGLQGTAHLGELLSDGNAAEPHPLARFAKPSALRYSGRQHVDDGELSKITALPYKAQESLQERRLALKGGRASQWNNQGMGRSIFGAGKDPEEGLL